MCIFFSFCVNALLFRLISAKFAIFVTNCPNLNFFKSTIILRKYSITCQKLAKYVIFRNWVPNLCIQLHSINGKIGKISLPKGSNKLPLTVRNCPVMHKNGRIFRKRVFRSIKTKVFGKQRIFRGGNVPPSRFFSTGFLNFGGKSRHPALKFKPWTRVQKYIF